MEKVLQRRTKQTSGKLKEARKKLKREVKVAKNRWVVTHSNNVNDFGTKKHGNPLKF